MVVLGIIIFIGAIILRIAAGLKAPEGTDVATIKNPLFASALIGFTVGGLLIISGYFNWKNTSAEERNVFEKNIKCWNCGKSLTNDYNRICTSADKFACTPCYRAVMKEINAEIR